MNAALQAKRVEYEAYMDRWRAGGRPVASYACPTCTAEIEVPRPSRAGEVWDSLMTCPECGAVHFKVVPAHGPVEVREFEGAA